MSISFIDMMASHRWTETDIVNRTEAMIASEFPATAVEIINRKATAAALGQYELSAEEQAEIARYNAVCLAAREAGEAARADMRLLGRALDHEAAQRVIAAADDAVLELVARRAPAPEPEPEPGPEPEPALVVGSEEEEVQP